MDINSLQTEDLVILHETVIKARKLVLELVDKYNQSANSLVSRTFEHEIEMIYGKRKFKEIEKIGD